MNAAAHKVTPDEARLMTLETLRSTDPSDAVIVEIDRLKKEILERTAASSDNKPPAAHHGRRGRRLKRSRRKRII